MTIGQKIKLMPVHVCTAINMLEGVANLTGISRQRVQAIEAGTGYPLIPTIQKIAKALGCPLRDLLDEPLELYLDAPEPLRDTDCPCENAEKCMFFKVKK